MTRSERLSAAEGRCGLSAAHRLAAELRAEGWAADADVASGPYRGRDLYVPLIVGPAGAPALDALVTVTSATSARVVTFPSGMTEPERFRYAHAGDGASLAEAVSTTLRDARDA